MSCIEKIINAENIKENSISESIKNLFSNKDDIRSNYSTLDKAYTFNYKDKIRDKLTQLSIKVYLSDDSNKLIKIQVESYDKSISEIDLDYYYFKEIYQQFTEGLIHPNEKKYTVRVYYSILHNTGFKGEYIVSWKSKIKFKPLFNEKQKNTLVKRIIAFDCEVKAVSLSNARSKAMNRVKDFTAYLSVLINIGFIDINSKVSHYIRQDGEKYICELQRNAFFDEECNLMVIDNMNGLSHKSYYKYVKVPSYFSVSTFKDETLDISSSYIKNNSFRTNTNMEKLFLNHKIEKSKVENNYAENILDKNFDSFDLRIPKQIRKYFRGILDLSTKQGEYFRNSCRLYNISQTCGIYEPTLMMAYMVSSVECLAKSEKISFSKFMERYLDKEYNKDFCDFLYGNLRSGHFHSGDMFFNEYNVDLDITLNRDFQNILDTYNNGKYYLRKAIIAWIKHNIL
ncbi:hypothetical protein KM800_04575 [Clostridium tyrobutyricum]|uniref:hypothetical protein n=1 Tax=Clostridium tyrobutyricum TaxID=1519 RepID=UPI001C387190|nr:hypothetical protein [Clostridium tyrobutyricum]MBV4418603.1 hypothetical protein [Clostridium tyrobutyricum]